MLTRPIPRHTEVLPAIGCGTYRAFDTREARAIERLGQVIGALVAGGGRVVDSSPMYGEAEDVAGALLAAKPDANPFIATKVWTRGKHEGVRQMQQSLRYFRTTCIDLMQVHNLVDVDTHIRTLLDWKAAGHIRYLGITHYANSAHRDVENAMRKYPIDFVQINYSLDNRGAEQRLLPLAQELGLGVLINYPFGGGELVRRLRGRPLPDFATKLGFASWAQILLHFIVAHQAVTCAIPGTGNPAHMIDNIAGGAEQLGEQRAEILAWWAKASL